MMSIAIALHILAAAIWVGGMFFAYSALRPATTQVLEAEHRLRLWCEVFKLFFRWVWLCLIVLLITGSAMIYWLGGMAGVGIHVHLMLLLGIVMILIFIHVFFSPFKRLQKAVSGSDWAAGAKALNQIRQLILMNLTIGLIVITLASAGRYLVL